MTGVQLDHTLVGCEPVGQVLRLMREVGKCAANQAFGGTDGVQRVGFLGGKGGFADFDGVTFTVADDGGRVVRPSISVRQTGLPLRTVATRLLVVPKSMPTARRC